jgi:hypothetical protein
MKTSRNLWRLAGAWTSKRIPATAHCGIRGCPQTCTHVLLSASGRHYCCAAHAARAQELKLGYEIFEGERE